MIASNCNFLLLLLATPDAIQDAGQAEGDSETSCDCLRMSSHFLLLFVEFMLCEKAAKPISIIPKAKARGSQSQLQHESGSAASKSVRVTRGSSKVLLQLLQGAQPNQESWTEGRIN